ncbi:MAG: GntR family transcriptional regulator [Burkholderiales bacterium]|nr:MAG: GntR family transcriptional regulator [Burkholderiales bacterium]
MQTQLRLRALILSGELAPGARVTELALVERLGVSRSPIRVALLRLEQEGLLQALSHGGYRVRRFSEADIHDAIEVRGTLEGLAVRLAAERGADPALLARARDCLGAIDAVLARPTFTETEFSAYVEANERLHALLIEMAGSEVVGRQLDRAINMPFASPNAFMMAQTSLPGGRELLIVAQDQHHQVIDAIERREGARAQALMLEHARLARRNLERVLAHRASLALVPGAALIEAGCRAPTRLAR